MNAIKGAEVAGKLPAVLEDASDSPAIQSYAAGYKDGYRKALLAIALTFGLFPSAWVPGE